MEYAPVEDFPFEQLYAAKPLTYARQIEELLRFGLSDTDGQLPDILETVSFHRLLTFLALFYRTNPVARPIDVSYLWELYSFDRRLRNLLFEGLARLEIAFRAKFSYCHAQFVGSSFCYSDFRYFSDATIDADLSYERMYANIEASIKKAIARRPEMAAFQERNPESPLPVEMVMEVADFGILQNYYRLLPKALQIEIANSYGVSDYMFRPWLTLLNRLRNKCAHHEFILFSIFATQKIQRYCSARGNPMLAKLEKAVKYEDDTDGVSLYLASSIMAHLLTIIRPQSSWVQRLRDFMLDESHAAGRNLLVGFNDSYWTTCALWK